MTCNCCTRPLDADAVLLNISWQLAHSAHVSGDECLLNVLSCTYEQPLTLRLTVLLLRPFVQVLQYYVLDNSWRVVLQHMEIKSFFKVGDMMRMSHSTYHQVFQYLTKALNVEFNSVFYFHKFFIEALIHLHTISSWSVAYSRDCLCAGGAVLSFEDAGQLLILFLEGTVASGMTSLVHSVIDETRSMAALIQASG